ncbi:glycosyltransferase family 2 protein [candidate division CSSED10-310 bacterium]|uniref:Glycosyltransferase family 2 protein n=1 Tax=candidate division CSSED10-310 bacterium TaxID=2855610 RepID=A0ABV6YUL3_UNCC1
MDRSIFRNPKSGSKSALKLGAKEGLITNVWRLRVIYFFKSIIPSHVVNDHQLWLTKPEDIVEFTEKLKDPQYDLSMIEYVCIVETIADIYDLMNFFSTLGKRLPVYARVLFYNFNWLWAPLFRISGLLGFSRNRTFGNFYREGDLDCFLELSGWEITRRIKRFIFPFKIPFLSGFFDQCLVKLPFFRNMAINTFFIARRKGEGKIGDHSATVLIPCKNEESNVEAAVSRTPQFGKSVELLFINDQSTDSTVEKIVQCQRDFPDKNIVLVQGKGLGKAEAIREGMQAATGDVCLILDADLTVIPEDLPQFYEALVSRRADFVHGTRFVYSHEHGAMRFANIIGNIFFSSLFTYILEQRTTDTLCGTKVFWRRDWPLFEEMRNILKHSDLWGDYNLIFGASRYGLKIAQLPVRYFERLEGDTKMNKRLRNGLVMFKVASYALWKVKFFS